MQYEDIATGRIGTATAVDFKLGGNPLVRLEWRNGDNQKEIWYNEGRLAMFKPEENGQSL
jgi:hypothetical protein